MLDHDKDSYELIAPALDGHPGDLTRDGVLDNITLYWLTNTGVSSTSRTSPPRLASARLRTKSIQHRGVERRRHIPNSVYYKGSSGVVVGGVEDSAVTASPVEGLNHPDSPLPPRCCGRSF
jgi:hypothetical protein